MIISKFTYGKKVVVTKDIILDDDECTNLRGMQGFVVSRTRPKHKAKVVFPNIHQAQKIRLKFLELAE